MQIFETFDSTELLNSYKENYIKDLNIYVKIYSSSMLIIDLSNALKVGKTCTNYRVYAGENDWGNSFKSDFEIALMENKITFEEFIKNLLEDKAEYENIRTSKSTTKAINTFSPFAEIKPIKVPIRWTLAHVWKAVMAGQINIAFKEQQLTDDFAYDASVNFGRGEIDAKELAKDLIESPSGWWVRAEEEKNGVIWINVNCHHFNYNKVCFEVTKQKRIDSIELAG